MGVFYTYYGLKGKGLMIINFVLIIIVILACFTIWWVYIYNQLIGRKNLVQEHWGEIETLLKRRRDLIPNLIEISKNDLGDEQGIFDKIKELRSQCIKAINIAEKSAAERNLSIAMIEFFSITEKHPVLLSSPDFIELKTRYSEIENKIKRVHENYNKAAENLNEMIKSFPCDLIAKASHFYRVAYFEL